MKKTFKDHAAAAQEDFWRWAVDDNFDMLDRLLRRGVPMPHEARILLADLLKSVLPKPRGRPTSDAKQKWQAVDRLMKIERRKGMTVSDAAAAVSVELPKLGWSATPKQIEDRWRKWGSGTRNKSSI
jgi:hypothetical protein